MQIVLIGADIEENLGVGMVAAVAASAGHAVRVVAFDGPDEAEVAVERVLALDPDVVGLSIQFQHRSAEFLGLARRLRECSFAGHLCCGGQFPSMAWREVLSGGHGVDSVVLHEGESSFVELLEALGEGRRLVEVPGLALPGDDGAPVRTAGRGLIDDLDALPFAARYRPHALQYGVPFIPIMGGRGCWGRCAFCSITSCHRDARAAGGGARLRHRSPEGLADEMALLARAAGGEAIFCFHDDNFLLPRPRASLERVRRLRAALDARGVGRAALVGKCRPDSTTPELLRDLADLGVIRLYVGVENASQAGADHLGRRTRVAKVREALASCRQADIFACYNLLLFEPGTTVDHVRENVAFIRDHAVHPINFCRAEAYYGTPLMRQLEARGALGGNYLGFTYRLEDEAAELVFRVCAAAFRQRNFDPHGVANRYMGLGYAARILEFFYGRDERVARLRRRADDLTCAISLETAGFIEEAIAIVERAGARAPDRLARQTALLGLRVAEADGRRHAELDDAFAAMNAHARRARRARGLGRFLAPLAPLAPGAVLVGTLLAGCNSGCAGRQDYPPPPDPVPQDVQPNDLPPDPVPPDVQVLDPVPPNVDAVPPPYKPPEVQQPVDPPPPPPPDPLPRPVVPNPVPLPPDPLPPPRVNDPAPYPRGQTSGLERLDPVSAGFRDASAGALDDALPLWRPPRVVLEARRDGEGVIVVTAACADRAMSLRWEGDGAIRGRGRCVRWTPDSDAAQLRVAARTAGGVAVAALRAATVKA